MGMKILLKVFKTEIAPTKEQRQKIICSIGVARFLYNQYIAYNKKTIQNVSTWFIRLSSKAFCNS